ncbi:HEAT repeat domain-containing protein [Adlercreutzia sp. ZJ242]|uniref:HEAT repeat domain-containing protein n=1 Tax=Adlercreutzia sp. ZJ242 TaxID=2709409 RepID=UPI0013EB3D24|nr:hypothetical protein [Adlercreutzia sp. ZJ242]
MSGKAQGTTLSADEIAEYEKKVEGLVEVLSSGSRRERQQAAQVISLIGKAKAELLVPHANALVDALNRPEAQTRWEVLDALTELVPYESRTCDKALVGAETALFDEDSGPLRLAAMRFLCRLGATTENRSEKTWPLIDEAIQCYHGDLEFQDMLLAVIDFSNGKLSPSVRESLAARMKFDAANSKGSLKKRAAQIIENVSR